MQSVSSRVSATVHTKTYYVHSFGSHSVAIRLSTHIYTTHNLRWQLILFLALWRAETVELFSFSLLIFFFTLRERHIVRITRDRARWRKHSIALCGRFQFQSEKNRRRRAGHGSLRENRYLATWFPYCAISQRLFSLRLTPRTCRLGVRA